MAKSQEKAALDQTVNSQNNSNTKYNEQYASNKDITQNDEAYAGYKGFADTGGIDKAAKDRLLQTTAQPGTYGGSSGGGSGGGGGAAPGARQDYFSSIGPLDKTMYDSAENAFKQLDTTGAQRFADTGGLDQATMDRMRGMGGYDEFAKTGGYSEEDKGNIRAKALSPISAFDTARRDDMSTRRSVQGGYTPGFDASSRALSRDTARNISDTSLNAEVGIKDKVNAGKQWGISGQAQSEQQVQQLKTQNMMEGQRQVDQIKQAVASGQMMAADGKARIAEVQQQTDLAIASGRTQRDIAEMQIAASNGNAAASRELAKLQLDTQNQQFVMQLEQSGKLAGLGGMDSIYQTGANRGLDITNSQSGSNVNYGGLRAQQADQIGGVFDGIEKGVGMASGVISSFTGGGGYQPQNKGITGMGSATPWTTLQGTNGRVPGLSA